MNSVLIITYYWPPVVGAGVQRVAGFCRHLPEFGYEPRVLTPATGRDGAGDDGPIRVHRASNRFDPAAWIARNRGGGAPAVTGDARSSLLEIIRLNLFIPDSRIGWRRPALRAAAAIIAERRPDLVFTSAPPYTVHLVGAELKRRFGLPWVADFRDPWLECHAYNRVWRAPVVRAITRRMELRVLTEADRVVCAMDSQRDLFAAKIRDGADRIVTVRNGTDGAAWAESGRLADAPNFILSHFGTVYPDGLNWDFFRALADWVRGDPARARDFVLRMVGTVPGSVRAGLRGLFAETNLDLSDPVPPADIRRMLGERQALLLLVNSGDLHRYSHPSKVFDYMASGNAILASGDRNHEVMGLLTSHAGDRSAVVGRPEETAAAMTGLYDVWRAGRLPDRPAALPVFDRRNLTRQLAEVFNDVLARAGQTTASAAAPSPGTSTRCTIASGRNAS